MFLSIVPKTVLCCAAQEPAAIDVEEQIFPILTSQCIGCHGPDKADGELRLDRLEHVQRGGHSGNPILGNVELSELLRRLTSSNPDYRMPEGAPPLPQEQIELFRAWITNGAQWPDDATVPSLPKHSAVAVKTDVSTDLTLDRKFDRWLDSAMSIHEKVSVMLVPLLGLLFTIIVLERTKQNWISKAATRTDVTQTVTSDAPGPPPNSIVRIALSTSGLHYLIGFLVLCIASMLLYHVRHVEELSRIIEKVSHSETTHEQVAVNKRGGIVVEGVEIYRSKHPPRMGGDYFRGNDERNRALFNNGYYRTALLRVSLRDQNDRRIDWNDRIETEKCFIKLEVERSPYATPDLFQPAAMRSCYLSNLSTSVESPPPAHLIELSGSEKWFASYPIVNEQTPNKRVEGMIGVYNGSSPHYAIGYNLDIVDGVVAPTSEIWLGTVLLPGNVLFPGENEIAFSEWFDFLPIPEITRPHSTDPELLGIPEHQPYLDSLESDGDP